MYLFPRAGWDAVDYVVGGYFRQVYSGEQQFAAVRQSIQNDADSEFQRIKEELIAILNG